MHEAHDAYLCVGEKTYVNVKDRRKYSNQHYLKSSEEMYNLFSDLPDALENNANFPFRVSYRPKNSCPVLPNIQSKEIKDVDKLLSKGFHILICSIVLTSKKNMMRILVMLKYLIKSNTIVLYIYVK